MCLARVFVGDPGPCMQVLSTAPRPRTGELRAVCLARVEPVKEGGPPVDFRRLSLHDPQKGGPSGFLFGLEEVASTVEAAVEPGPRLLGFTEVRSFDSLVASQLAELDTAEKELRDAALAQVWLLMTTDDLPCMQALTTALAALSRRRSPPLPPQPRDPALAPCRAPPRRPSRRRGISRRCFGNGRRQRREGRRRAQQQQDRRRRRRRRRRLRRLRRWQQQQPRRRSPPSCTAPKTRRRSAFCARYESSSRR